MSGSQAHELETADAHDDTVRIRILPDAASPQSICSEAPQPSFDPYSTDIGAMSERARPRRTLDDMRRLSEAILRNRQAKLRSRRK
ncbi:MAG: hypothetical protein JO299_15475 [Gammaproteobacteria bacterium]|nr:hypothetical protein [Gammaproteobacteria bacterium]